MKNQRIALCPGSYDPVTKGHVNIIERAARLFDKVVVVVMVNPAKKSAFSMDERMDMLRLATRGIPAVEITCHDGLVAEYAKQMGACALVKGLRAITDFEYEFQMALMNTHLNPELETVYINTDAKYMYLSSSAVREIAYYGGNLSDFVPAEVEGMIVERLWQKSKAAIPAESGGKA